MQVRSKDHVESARITALGHGDPPTLSESGHLENCAECLLKYKKELVAAVDLQAQSKAKPA